MDHLDKPDHFIERIIKQDIHDGRVSAVKTRFPPEPNGYLHIGHAKSIWLNFTMARQFGGQCHLRFDDTNPEKESVEYVQSIQSDVRWLGFAWDGSVRFTSDYFDQLFQWALQLVEQGDAYVCDLNADELREYRGTLTEPGRDSPFRTRSIEENLRLFQGMQKGEFSNGSRTLRAKIDMASPNVNLRDPIMYRIIHATHHQTKNRWCIYPSYDFAHGQSDAIEGITHSLCTIEFADHRPLYEWFLDKIGVKNQPKQYEFSRLNLNYTVTSKRKLKQLVDSQCVLGWDDPRMPTLSGMRRRGIPPEAIVQFCQMAGVTKVENTVDLGMLEFAIREYLNLHATRAMCVTQPLKVTLVNYPEGQTESLLAPNHPQDESFGTRCLPFGRSIYIEKSDFQETANKKFKRLTLDKRVRLRHAYVIEAEEVIRNDDGEIIELLARVIEGTVGHNPEDGVKPKGVIHWVSATEHMDCTVRRYDRLFSIESPGQEEDYLTALNPDSVEVIQGCKIEVNAQAEGQVRYQFERMGYFMPDVSSTQESPVFNQIIGLKDNWDKKA